VSTLICPLLYWSFHSWRLLQRNTANPVSILRRPDKSIRLCRAGAFDLLTNGKIENIIQISNFNQTYAYHGQKKKGIKTFNPQPELPDR
jgi:hypothetical protein